MKKTRLILSGIMLLAALVASGCAAQSVKDGDTVTINYTLALDDGSIYYTTSGGEPHQFTLGEGALIPGFEEAVIGMQVGESKTVKLPPEKAYGSRRPELVMTGDRSLLPEGLQPVVGQQLETTISGEPAMVMVMEVTETTVTLDANHPLAGQNLTFSIELVAIGENLAAGGLANQATINGVILAAAMLGSGAAFLYLRGRRRRPPATASVSPARRKEGLLAELARLDDDFRITEAAYHKARAQKKAELVKLMQRSREANGHK